MMVEELMKMLKDKNPKAKVRIMIGNQDGIVLEDLENLGCNQEGDEVYIPANFNAICTHEVGREAIN